MCKAHKNFFGYHGVDHTPHYRPLKLTMYISMVTFSLRLDIESMTRPQQRADITSRFARGSMAEQACQNLRCLRRSLTLENASLWPLGPGNIVCAYGTTILTNRESSELVGERIFYALQVRTRII